MEREFFEWAEWCGVDIASFQFYNCKVVKPFGPFRKGQKLETVFMDYENGVIQVYNKDNDGIFNGKLILGIE